jgi:hypothetical protein
MSSLICLKLLSCQKGGGKTEFVEGFAFFVSDGEGKFAVRTFERPTEGDGGEIGGVFEWDGVKGGERGQGEGVAKFLQGLLPLGEGKGRNRQNRPPTSIHRNEIT